MCWNTNSDFSFFKLTNSPKKQQDKTMKNKEKIKSALNLIYQYGSIDGGHHKQWVLDQVVRILTGDKYNEWINDFYLDENGEYISEWEGWDTGIAP